MQLIKNYSILIPILVLIVMVISLGIMIFDLGFFMDDWPNIFFQIAGGSESTQLLHEYDGRPLQGWFRVFLYDLLGTNPWVWQVFSLLLRYLTVIFTWLTFRKIWPKAELQMGMAAILFAVYPIFAQQPLAITFIGHWTSFLFVVLSIYLMLLAIDHPKWYIPLTLAALALSATGLVIIEYFIGLEFIRPLVLWFAYSKKSLSRQQRWKKTILHFLPYFLLAILFVAWRIFFIQLPVSDRNELDLVGSFLNAPVQTILNLILMVVQDFDTMLIAGWYKTYQPEILKLDGPIDILSILVTVGISALLLVVFYVVRKQGNLEQAEDTPDGKQQIITGIVIILFGAVPGWLVGRQVGDSAGLWNDRFGMASMAGAALVVVVLLEKLLRSTKVWLVMVAVLIGLASGWQIRNTNDYRWSWIFQQRFYNQLIWRIPSLEPDTLFLAEREFFSKMGVYPTSFAINTLYPQSRNTDQVDYWFLTIPKYFGSDMESFLQGEPVFAGHWQAKFSGHSHSSIVVDFRGEDPHCLWVLSPEDAQNPEISDTTRASLSVSDLSRIRTESALGNTNFGLIAPEPSDTWCYYYQKAELAQQMEDWAEIESLWYQSSRFQSGALDGVELTPFIDGFLHLGDFEQARELTVRAKSDTSKYDPYLCSIWENALAGNPLNQKQKGIAQTIETNLGCDLP